MSAPIQTLRSADLLAQDAEYGGAVQTDDLMEGLEELWESIPGYDMAEEYYEGTRPEYFASRKLRQMLEQTGTTFRLNYAKTPVDTMVERLEIIDIVGGDDKTRKMLQALWEINQMDIESMDIMRRACEFGDAYALVWPNDDIEEEFEDDDAGDYDYVTALDDSGIDIYYNDPRTMRAIYDTENPRRMKFVIKHWCHKSAKGKELFRANLYYKDRIEKSITKKAADPKKAESWLRFIDVQDEEGEAVWPIPNPFKRIPIFHFRTDRPYGVPEHKDAYGPQDAINKIVIAHISNIDFNAAPQRYALSDNDLDDDEGDGEDFGQTDVWEDDPTTDPDVDANVREVSERRAQMEGDAGTMWFLKNIKAVGQFAAAGPEPFMTPLKTYILAMAQVTRTPVHRFDESGNPPSGESLKVREQPFIRKVKYRHQSFGATWSDMLGFIALILKDPNYQKLNDRLQKALPPELPNEDPDSTNFNEGELNNDQANPARLAVTWANPSAADDQLTWSIVILKRDAGVPARQALLDAGYSKKLLDEWGVPASKWANEKVLPVPGAPVDPNAPPGPPAQVDLPAQPPPHLPGVRSNPTATVGKLD